LLVLPFEKKVMLKNCKMSQIDLIASTNYIYEIKKFNL